MQIHPQHGKANPSAQPGASGDFILIPKATAGGEVRAGLPRMRTAAATGAWLEDPRAVCAPLGRRRRYSAGPGGRRLEQDGGASAAAVEPGGSGRRAAYPARRRPGPQVSPEWEDAGGRGQLREAREGAAPYSRIPPRHTQTYCRSPLPPGNGAPLAPRLKGRSRAHRLPRGGERGRWGVPQGHGHRGRPPSPPRGGDRGRPPHCESESRSAGRRCVPGPAAVPHCGRPRSALPAAGLHGAAPRCAAGVVSERCGLRRSAVLPHGWNGRRCPRDQRCRRLCEADARFGCARVELLSALTSV